ncbi:MAG: MBL fold metallo-hydrolase [Chlamydiae bacterium]|nr:MBL fold metallo-hydrolase [Chlamydiota bacterium]
MPLFCPLASGSKGNSLLLASRTTKVLIDAGLSVKQLKERLGELGLTLDEIDAIVITHEHSDHIRGLEVLCKQQSIPILANRDTAQGICQTLAMQPKFKIFSTGERFTFGDIDFHPFSVQHDTMDPVAFVAFIEGVKIGICTDLGFATTLVKSHLQHCDYLYIESNHEPSMVHACSRPLTYKQRVLGRQGHLSNQSCAELLKEIYHQGLKKIYLAHLSEECNNPEVALKKSQESLRDHLEKVSITIAHQEKISEPLYF